MKAILTVPENSEENYGEYLLKCPFCNYESEENFQQEECSHPMLWCEECAACSVLELKKDEKLSEGEHKISLCKILKVVNHELCYFVPTQDVSQTDIRIFIENGYDGLGFKDSTKTYINNAEDVNFNIGLECGTYNVEEPKIPYPKFFSTDHDEDSFMFLECQNSKGETFKVTYWGY